MTTLVKVIGSAIKNGMRTVKAVFGKSNVQEVYEVAPHGIDSCPPDNKIAAHSTTSVKGINVVYGYYNNKQVSLKGETRIYSTNTAGSSVSMYLYLKNDGTAAFGGTADNLVRYTPLNTAIQNDIVTFINTQLPLIATGIAAGGGSYTPGTMSVDISAAKITEIKTL